MDAGDQCVTAVRLLQDTSQIAGGSCWIVVFRGWRAAGAQENRAVFSHSLTPVNKVKSRCFV